MIRLRVTRTEDDGTETDIGDVSLLEVGIVASHRETPEGAGVMRDLVARLKWQSRPRMFDA